MDIDTSAYAPRRRRFEPITIIGLAFTVALHVGSVIGVVIYKRKQAEAHIPPPPRTYVVAKLVRLGKPRDKNKLPDKEVPRVATVKPKGVSLDADPNEKPKPKPKRKRDRDAVNSDRLRRSFDKASAFAKIQPDKLGEGDPNGVRGGTAKKGSRGDMYMTRLADLWNRTWSLPSIITPKDAKKLYVLIVLRIDSSGRIKLPLKFDRRSGNSHFDGSISAAWTRIGKIPLPPGDRLASILANGLALKLNWRGMR